MNNFKDFEKYITKVTNKQWQHLFDLIPNISKAKTFGSQSKIENYPDGSFTMPHIIPSKVVSEFHNLVYDIGIVQSFDWSGWEEGKKLLKNPDSNYNKLDIVTLCKLITTIIRADRFNEGFLVSCFEKGIVLKIILALRRKINTN